MAGNLTAKGTELKDSALKLVLLPLSWWAPAKGYERSLENSGCWYRGAGRVWGDWGGSVGTGEHATQRQEKHTPLFLISWALFESSPLPSSPLPSSRSFVCDSQFYVSVWKGCTFQLFIV